MITNEQIALVQSSYDTLRPSSAVVGRLLYERIFTLAPGTRELFDEDITPQARRLMSAVTLAVDGLERLDELAPYLVKLGARHHGYGVTVDHFAVVAEALMWTLEQGLGEAFTPDVAAAWLAAWDVVAGAMMEGLTEAAADAMAAA
jgi:nitric oxide dioxygenase